MLVDAIMMTHGLIGTRHMRARWHAAREARLANGPMIAAPQQSDAPQGKIVAAEIKDGALVVSVEEE